MAEAIGKATRPGGVYYVALAALAGRAFLKINDCRWEPIAIICNDLIRLSLMSGWNSISRRKRVAA